MKNDITFRTMVLKAMLFLSPVLLLISLSVVFDPFKVYHRYDDYEKNNFVPLNREMVCLKLYQQNCGTEGYDSFIFGNSRSQAFKINNWKIFLPPNAKPYHFDGAGGGLYGIRNRVKYIDESGGRLANALLVVDELSLSLTENAKGHNYISPPELSGESRLAFYNEFSKPLLNIPFAIGFIDYSIFGTHRKYMGKLIYNERYPNFSNPKTGDVYYGVDRELFEDPERYYRKQADRGIFYDRSTHKVMPRPATHREKELLTDIRRCFSKHGTDYRIIVGPLYDQKPLGKDHLQLLRSIFGADAVYDYSGVNRFTESVHNYYEDSHFRPHVADEIMKEIYSRRPCR